VGREQAEREAWNASFRPPFPPSFRPPRYSAIKARRRTMGGLPPPALLPSSPPQHPPVGPCLAHSLATRAPPRPAPPRLAPPPLRPALIRHAAGHARQHRSPPPRARHHCALSKVFIRAAIRPNLALCLLARCLLARCLARKRPAAKARRSTRGRGRASRKPEPRPSRAPVERGPPSNCLQPVFSH
jgi:hypothetical protein